MPFTIPGAEPYLLPGGETGCLLVHGFTSMPDEMRPLTDHLHAAGHTVLGLRLPGHATQPADLQRLRYPDWLAAVEDGIAILRGTTSQIFLVGQSLGGILALIAASRLSVHGVIALSTPFNPDARPPGIFIRLVSLVNPYIKKGVSHEDSHPLATRREKDYPAYPIYPSRVVLQFTQLQRDLAEALPRIRIPVLLIQGTADNFIPPDSMLELYSHLNHTTRQIFWLKDAHHGIALDANRQPALEQAAAFIQHITNPEVTP
jgi:carboxylesterase